MTEIAKVKNLALGMAVTGLFVSIVGTWLHSPFTSMLAGFILGWFMCAFANANRWFNDEGQEQEGRP